ncbi:MAG TPA: hypothetical protein VF933_20930 [Streptosporangiaceae bacterium]
MGDFPDELRVSIDDATPAMVQRTLNYLRPSIRFSPGARAFYDHRRAPGGMLRTFGPQSRSWITPP